MFLEPVELVRLLLAILAGGVIGMEREFRDKDAGFRTLIFICVGAALFTMLSSKLAGDKDPTRIAASIVSGVGFLGAGVILRERGRVVGLTTAAMIWLTAALGMTIGGGYYGLAGSTLAAMVVVLLLFPAIEHLINNIREERSYEIVGLLHARKIAGLEETISRHGLKVHGFKQKKENDRVYCTWHVSGAPAKHEALVRALVIDPEIQELHY